MTCRFLAVSMGLLLLFTGFCPAEEVSSESGEALKVHLQDDGKLSGRLRVFYATGKAEPADAKITFMQDGTVVEAAQTDDMGHFHLTGLEPGQYTAKASIDSGATDFTIDVVEFAQNVDAESMFLDATLTPTPDGQIIEGDVMMDGGCDSCGEIVTGDMGYVEEGIVGGEIIGGDCMGGCGYVEAPIMDAGYVDAGYVEAPIMDAGYIEPGFVDAGYVDAGCCGGGFSSGGCCGGGGGGIGGGGRLLGLAALGTAIALPLALNDDDDKGKHRPVVSPYRPY